MDEFKISVTDPKKHNESYSMYISYKVISISTRSGFALGSQEVNRRFSDFEWLANELSKQFPGIIIPALPEKQVVGNLSTEFVESRRRSLEKFLYRITQHPELSNSLHFVAFLQKESINEVKADVKASKTDKPKSKPGWFDSTVNTLTTNKIELEKSAADIKIEEISQYITQLEKQMTSVTKHAEALTKSSREISQAYFEFSQSSHWLANTEGDSFGAALGWVGTTTNNLSTTIKKHAELEIIKLVEPLEEYLRVIASIRLAIQQRHTKKSNYISCLVDVEAKQQAYRKVLGVTGKESQVNTKEQAVISAQNAADTAKMEFEKVSERLLTEFELFKNQKSIDFKEIILNFVNLQIELNQKSEKAWSDLIPEVEKIVVQNVDNLRAVSKAENIMSTTLPPHNFSIGRSNQSTTNSNIARTSGTVNDTHNNGISSSTTTSSKKFTDEYLESVAATSNFNRDDSDLSEDQRETEKFSPIGHTSMNQYSNHSHEHIPPSPPSIPPPVPAVTNQFVEEDGGSEDEMGV